MVAELYTVFGSELLNYCCMMCRNIGDAQDLLQETFLKALSYQDLLEGMETKQRRAWLYKVARNLFYDQCRRRAVEKKYSPAPDIEDDTTYSEAEVGFLLSVLPSDLSELFIKRYLEGYNSKELSELYGCSASGIRAKLSRARKILREECSR